MTLNKGGNGKGRFGVTVSGIREQGAGGKGHVVKRRKSPAVVDTAPVSVGRCLHGHALRHDPGYLATPKAVNSPAGDGRRAAGLGPVGKAARH